MLSHNNTPSGFDQTATSTHCKDWDLDLDLENLLVWNLDLAMKAHLHLELDRGEVFFLYIYYVAVKC